MIKRKLGKPTETPFEEFPELTIGHRTLVPGDPCRIRYQRGTYVFKALVTNTATGAQWVDVWTPTTFHGPGRQKAVRVEDVSYIPKRRKKK